MFETNEEKKLELMRELMCEFIPTTLGRLESRLQERGGQFFVGNQEGLQRRRQLLEMIQMLTEESQAMDSLVDQWQFFI